MHKYFCCDNQKKFQVLIILLIIISTVTNLTDYFMVVNFFVSKFVSNEKIIKIILIRDFNFLLRSEKTIFVDYMYYFFSPLVKKIMLLHLTWLV